MAPASCYDSDEEVAVIFLFLFKLQLSAAFNIGIGRRFGGNDEGFGETATKCYSASNFSVWGFHRGLRQQQQSQNGG